MPEVHKCNWTNNFDKHRILATSLAELKHPQVVW